MADFKLFHLFDPQKMDRIILPNAAGNYIFLLREGCKLPQIEISPEIQSIRQKLSSRIYWYSKQKYQTERLPSAFHRE